MATKSSSLECVLCAFGTSPVFHTPSELHEHILQHDQDYESEGTLQDDEVLNKYMNNDPSCPKCGWEFQGGVGILKEHVASGWCRRRVISMLLEEERRFICHHGNCDAAFNRKCELKRHEAEVHARVRPFSCTLPQCNKTFTRKEALTKHVLSVHHRQRRYKCQECPEKFSTNYDLKRHCKRAHRGARPYPCDMCSAGFTQKSQLTMHKGRTHRFVCHICQQIFWGEASFEQHVAQCENTENVDPRHSAENIEENDVMEKMIHTAVGLQSNQVPMHVGVEAKTW